MIRALAILLLTYTGLAAEEAPLDIITYNIRQDTAGDKGPRDWQQRKDRVGAYLLDKNASIIGLQEVRHNQLLDLDQALPDHVYTGVGRDDGKTRGEYSPILFNRKLWKLDPGEHGTFWLSDTPDIANSRSWGNRYTRICTWARLIGITGPERGSAIYIYNTHWDHQSQPSRVKSGELILKTIVARTHQEDPFIFMGDLNATMENPAVKALLASGLLIDHGQNQFRSSSLWEAPLVPGLRIDHIFTSVSIKKAIARVESNANSAKESASDHHPVRLSISRRPPAAQPIATEPMVFGEGGQIKMLYDCRQRPQAVYLNDKVHIVFNAGGEKGAGPKSRTKAMAVTYDPATRSFSEIVTIGKASRDHHYGPVIWADEDDYLHVLSACHKTPGTHLISKEPGTIGSSLEDWKAGPEIVPRISYPCLFNIYDDKELIYYRTDGHTSSWTYRISDDNGKTWTGPDNDVTDMDINGRRDWSSYQTKLLSKDGNFLHVAFMTYDDVKTDDPEKTEAERFYNPRYDKTVSNEWKYNLYHIKIDLRTHEITNTDGDVMKTPMDIDYADSKCRIWDTNWRGAGVPPTIVLDEKGAPAFLHVLSSETKEEDADYYYVGRVEGKWEQTRITDSTHQWNSCHLSLDADGKLHAYLVVGDGHLKTDGYMDKHGGGRIEEWISSNKGKTWKKARDLTPGRTDYPGWRFNNIQPVRRPGGEIVDGMLLFYGWGDQNAPEARAFLLDERLR